MAASRRRTTPRRRRRAPPLGEHALDRRGREVRPVGEDDDGSFDVFAERGEPAAQRRARAARPLGALDDTTPSTVLGTLELVGACDDDDLVDRGRARAARARAGAGCAAWGCRTATPRPRRGRPRRRGPSALGDGDARDDDRAATAGRRRRRERRCARPCPCPPSPRRRSRSRAEARVLGRDDEELAARGARRLGAGLRHRDDALRVRRVGRRHVDRRVAGPAVAGLRRVAALDDEALGTTRWKIVSSK